MKRWKGPWKPAFQWASPRSSPSSSLSSTSTPVPDLEDLGRKPPKRKPAAPKKKTKRARRGERPWMVTVSQKHLQHWGFRLNRDGTIPEIVMKDLKQRPDVGPPVGPPREE